MMIAMRLLTPRSVRLIQQQEFPRELTFTKIRHNREDILDYRFGWGEELL